MTGNVFGSWRTTLAGILALVVGTIGSQLLPEIVKYLGGQPGLAWQLAGLALGAVGPAIMADAKKAADGLAATPKGFARLGVAIALMLGAAALISCAALSRVTGSTGSLDLGKGYVCSATASLTDQAACTKTITTSCTGPNGFANQTATVAPVPKLADGSCP